MKKYLFMCLVVSIGTANAASINNFTDGYDVSNWNQFLDGGSIDTTGTPNSIVEVSSNNNTGPTATLFTIASLGSGIVTFDWSYNTTDADGSEHDPFGWLLNNTFTQLTTDGLFGTQSGTESFAVETGDIFGFVALTTDSIEGTATAVISNFSAPAISNVPVPAAVWLFGSGLVGLIGMRKKSSKITALSA